MAQAATKAAEQDQEQPERVILLVAGESGSGKSFFVANCKNALIFDTDIGGGLSYADARIRRNGSERIEVGSYLEVMDEMTKRQRAGTLANKTTLAIDHLSTLHQESVQRHNPSGVEDFGKSYNKATREWRKIRHLARLGDYNLVCTAHLKGKYEDNKLAGVTTDASKNIEADMMIVLYLAKGGPPSTARVQKWRRDPEDPRGVIPSSFRFSMEDFVALHGWPLDGVRQEIPAATAEQLAELNKLLAAVKVDDGWVEKCMSRAKAESWDEFSAADLAKVISHLRGRLPS